MAKKMRYSKGGSKGSIGGVKAGHEPRTTHGDGSADSALNAICREAKQPTGQRTKRYSSGGMKGYGY